MQTERLTITEQMMQAKESRLMEAKNSHDRALALFGVIKNLTIYKNGEVR